jgi:predicted TIM-barrel fold metal-dependent hydrolase
MSRKLLWSVCILGVLSVLAGLVVNPSLVGQYLTPGGALYSPGRIAQIRLFQCYAIILGALFMLTALIIAFLPEKRRLLASTIGVCILGLVLIVMGVLLSSSFVEKNLSPIGVMEENKLSLQPYIQLVSVTLGCLILLVSLLTYRCKLSGGTRGYGVLLVALLFVVYCALAYVTYIRTKYPHNILGDRNAIGKTVNLLLGKDILLSEYEPEPVLTLGRKRITRAKYPVIDIHFHTSSSFATEEDRKNVAPDALIKTMDNVGVRMIVNLDIGNLGFEDMLDRYQRKYPDRFIDFYPVWFPPQIVSDEWLASRPAELEEAVKIGAQGAKLWKYLGLKTMDSSGKVIPVDDPRLDPLWAKIGELKIPVLWHMGDPAPFFRPINRSNERYEELSKIPDWSFYGPRFPAREVLLKQRENVLRKHPDVIFIAAHMGDNADDLAYIAYLLDTYPNYYVEISSRLPELGRQPYTARRFFIKYQDRILFGTDGGYFGHLSAEEVYRTYFEFLETENEYFDYPYWGLINQGRWKIYGINLPDEVLEKIYYKNAEKILFKKQTIIDKQ